MTFGELFLVEFLGGIASGVVLAAIGYLTRHRIVRAVRRSITKIEGLEQSDSHDQP